MGKIAWFFVMILSWAFAGSFIDAIDPTGQDPFASFLALGVLVGTIWLYILKCKEIDKIRRKELAKEIALEQFRREK